MDDQTEAVSRMSVSELRALLPTMLTVEQVQQVLNIGRTLAYQVVRDNTIPGVVTIGKATRRVQRDALLDWIAAGAGQGAGASTPLKRGPGRPRKER